MSVVAGAIDARHPSPAENALRVGVVGGLVASSMLFASLASAYLVRRSFADWRAAPALWPFAVLFFAALASAAIEHAARGEARGERRGWLVLGGSSVAYLAIALSVLLSIVASDAGLDSPHRAFIVVLLGLHVVHAVIGGAFSLWALRGRAGISFLVAVSLCRMVTHFLTLLLVAIVTLLFFFQ